MPLKNPLKKILSAVVKKHHCQNFFVRPHFVRPQKNLQAMVFSLLL